ncbi:MAG TPA: trehalose-phosphatase, partial [bacterium]|nr:trehalose-phosphatase [bacterium]
FGLVVGVSRNGNEDELLNEGAEVVIHSFHELETRFSEEVPLVSPETLPSALEESSPVYQKLDQHTPVFFLDYDGTLTPIVNRPEDAALSEEMRHLLRRLARLCTVAIVSGRDRQTVKNFVQLDELIYAGSHGFDITGPNNMNMQHEAGQAALPELDAAEQELQERLSHISGAQVERKKYAIAVHYRNVETEDVPGVKQIAEEILKQHPNLRKGGGKKIVELKPDIDWDKGKALLWLLNELKLDTPDIVPIYIGDDLTDEDAFRVLQSRGLGILVGEYGEETAAFYTLNSVQEVQRFLNEVIANLEDSSDE